MLIFSNIIIEAMYREDLLNGQQIALLTIVDLYHGIGFVRRFERSPEAEAKA